MNSNALKKGTQTHSCMFLSITALFTIAKRQKQPNYLSTDEWINKMWSVHTIEYYLPLKRNKVVTHVTTWMNFENKC